MRYKDNDKETYCKEDKRYYEWEVVSCINNAIKYVLCKWVLNKLILEEVQLLNNKIIINLGSLMATDAILVVEGDQGFYGKWGFE